MFAADACSAREAAPELACAITACAENIVMPTTLRAHKAARLTQRRVPGGTSLAAGVIICVLFRTDIENTSFRRSVRSALGLNPRPLRSVPLAHLFDWDLWDEATWSPTISSALTVK